MATPKATGPALALLDLRACGRLKTFSGKDEDWVTSWVFVAHSASEMETAEPSQDAKVCAWALFNIFTWRAKPCQSS